MHLADSLHPAVVVEEVAVANADWGSRSRMMTLGCAEVRVEPNPLLEGDVRVTGLVLVEPDILRTRRIFIEGLSRGPKGFFAESRKESGHGQ